MKYFSSAFIFLFGLLSFTPINSFAQWVRTVGPHTEITYSLACNDTDLFAGTYNGGVFLSIDYGDHWTQIDGGNIALGDTGFTNTDICAIATRGIHIFVGTNGHGIFSSTDYGSHWISNNDGLTNSFITNLVFKDTCLYSGTLKGIFLSTNLGTSWSATNIGLKDSSITALAASGQNIYASVLSGGIYISTNSGNNWTTYINEMTVHTAYTLVACSNGKGGANLFAGTIQGVFLSTDNGIIWNEVNTGLISSDVRSLATHDTILYASSSGYGIYYSLDQGAHWLKGAFPSNCVTLSVCGSYLFAGTGTPFDITGSVWRRPLSEMTTSVQDNYYSKPLDIILNNSYPNPFNPSTNIQFILPHSYFVTLKIYNILGQEISTLVSEILPVGSHRIEWNANGLPSGIYFCRLNVGSFAETKKLVLLR